MSRLSGHRPATADAVMSSSFHGTTTNVINHQVASNESNHLLDMTKSLIENFTSDSLMTQSLDPTILASSSLNSTMNTSMTMSSMIIKDFHPSPTNNVGANLYNEQSSIPIMHTSGPLITASKMMPVPESLMSPDCPPVTIQQQQHRPMSNLTSSASTSSVKNSRVQSQQQQRPSSSPSTTKSSRIARKTEKSSPSNSPRKALVNTANTKIHQNQSILKTSQNHSLEQQQQSTLSSVATTEDEDEDECDRVNVDNLRAIKKVAQKNQKQMENHHQLQRAVENKQAEKSAIIIQKLWRGYSTRKQTIKDMVESLQQKRTNDYILKLTQDMEMTKQALENERKIQQLQMQAINALWKKVSNMQTVNDNAAANENGITLCANGTAGADIVHDLTKTCSMLTNQVSKFIGNFHNFCHR